MSTQQRLLKDEILFNGGLDTDSDDKFVQQGDYVDAVNVMKLEDGSGGILVNVKGNEAVYDNFDQHEEYLCGWAYYDKNNSVILFIYSVERVSVIREFNPQTKESITLIDSNPLDILKFKNPKINNYYIDAKISGDWLAWTDNTESLKMLNIQDVKDGVVTVDEDYLNLCRKPPLDVPVFQFATDPDIAFNNLGGTYQFKYRYVYSDYRASVYSKASDLAVSKSLIRSTDILYRGKYDNILYVKFNSGDANVRWVDIIVRDGNRQEWGRVVKIDKNDPENVYSVSTLLQVTTDLSNNTDYYYRFTNSEGRVFVGDDGAKQYDTIPDRSEALSFLSEGNLVLGGNVSGKDLIELNVSLTEEHSNPGFTELWEINSIVTGTAADTDYIYIYFDIDDLVNAGGRDTWYAGDYVNFNFKVTVNTSGSNVIIEKDDQYVVFDRVITSVDSLGSYIANNAGSASVSGTTPFGNNINYDSINNRIEFAVVLDAVTISSYDTDRDDGFIRNTGYDYSGTPTPSTVGGYLTDQGFKLGVYHRLGLIYQDDCGRKWPVMTSDDTTVYIDSRAGSSNQGFGSIKYVIDHFAPEGAVSYRWAYAYKPKSFLQTIITDVSAFEEDTETSELIALDISCYNTQTYPQYNIEAGDVINVLRPGGSMYTLGDWSDSEPTFTIEEVRGSINNGTTDLNGIWLIVKPVVKDGYEYSDISPITESSFLNAIIEISKPPTEYSEELFYEIGGGGTVTEGRTHEDWISGSNYGYLNSGDVWMKPVYLRRRYGSSRDQVDGQLLYLESPFFSNDSSTVEVGIGDVNQEYPESRSKYDNTIVYSRKYFQDTQINGLSSFDSSRKKDVSDLYGKIKGLEELGNILTIICEEKVLTAYIGATEYTDASGNTNVIKSTEPVGYIRAHAERYGTFLKESICNNGRYVYFYDLLNGVVVRKAYNGLQTISGVAQSQAGTLNYRMRSYFKALSDNLLDSLYNGGSEALYDDVKCYMGYDYYHENLYVSFIDRVDATNSVLLIFNEPTNKWVSKQSFTDASGNYATMYPFTKSNIFSFLEVVGYLYQMNSDNVDRCNLYGVQQDSYIQFASHLAPNETKIFNSIGIHSDASWSNDSIEIDPSTSYPNGMYTKVLDSEWIYEEGVQKCYMPRNMKTRTSTANNYDRINGEEMRGKVVKVKITNDDTDKVELFKVDINAELSR